MFLIHIATALKPSVTAIAPFQLEISSTALQGPISFHFPQNGSTASFDLPVFSSAQPFDVLCRVAAFGFNGDEPQVLAFGFSGLGDGDSLNLLRHELTGFTATIFHSRAGKIIGCIAKCADGAQAHGCVECRSGALVGKICC